MTAAVILLAVALIAALARCAWLKAKLDQRDSVVMDQVIHIHELDEQLCAARAQLAKRAEERAS